jgi:hypothetical protein
MLAAGLPSRHAGAGPAAARRGPLADVSIDEQLF